MKSTMTTTILLLLGASVYACSSKETTNEPTPAPTESPASPTEPTPDPGKTPGEIPTLTPEEKAKNPIEGIAAAKVALQADEYTDGPVWHSALKALFFTVPLGDGATYRMNSDGTVIVVRAGSLMQGTTPIGNAVLANGELVTADAKRLVRTAVAAQGTPQPAVVATGFPIDGGVGAFDTLNDVVARKDGTLYVTDPGYFATTFMNRLFRVAPNGTVQVVETFNDAPRPNGIALSPDEKILYVGFTEPTAGTMPFIRRYTINADGTVGAWAKLTDVAPVDSAPDGLTVDQAGNVYVAVKGGVAVFRSDGTKIGNIAVPEKPTGLAFGGADMRTLYVTSQGTRIWELQVNVPGIAQ